MKALGLEKMQRIVNALDRIYNEAQDIIDEGFRPIHTFVRSLQGDPAVGLVEPLGSIVAAVEAIPTAIIQAEAKVTAAHRGMKSINNVPGLREAKEATENMIAVFKNAKESAMKLFDLTSQTIQIEIPWAFRTVGRASHMIKTGAGQIFNKPTQGAKMIGAAVIGLKGVWDKTKAIIKKFKKAFPSGEMPGWMKIETYDAAFSRAAAAYTELDARISKAGGSEKVAMQTWKTKVKPLLDGIYAPFKEIIDTVVGGVRKVMVMLETAATIVPKAKKAFQRISSLIAGAFPPKFSFSFAKRLRPCTGACDCGTYPSTGKGKYETGMGVTGNSKDISAPCAAMVIANGKTTLTLACTSTDFAQYLVTIENIRPSVFRGAEIRADQKVGVVASNECGKDTFHVSLKEVPSVEAEEESPSAYINPEDFFPDLQQPDPGWIQDCNSIKYIYLGFTIEARPLCNRLPSPDITEIERSADAERRRHRRSLEEEPGWPTPAFGEVLVLEDDPCPGGEWYCSIAHGVSLEKPQTHAAKVKSFARQASASIYGAATESSITSKACSQSLFESTDCAHESLFGGLAWPTSPCPDEYMDHSDLCHTLVCTELGHHCIEFAKELKQFPEFVHGGKARLKQVHRLAARYSRTTPELGSLSYRAHHGDLQVWHSIAPQKNMTNVQVRRQIVSQITAWYTAHLAIMPIAAPTPAGTAGGGADNVDVADADANVLTHKMHTLGKIMHTVQSSFCESQVGRNPGTNAIVSFKTRPCSTHQSLFEVDAANYDYAVNASTRILNLAAQRAPVDELERTLLHEVFVLHDGVDDDVVMHCEPVIRHPTLFERAAGTRERRADDAKQSFFSAICNKAGFTSDECKSDPKDPSAFTLGSIWPARGCGTGQSRFAPVSCPQDKVRAGQHHLQAMAEPPAANLMCERSKATMLTVGKEANVSESNPFQFAQRKVQIQRKLLHGGSRNDATRNKILDQLAVWYADAVEALGFKATSGPKTASNALWAVGKIVHVIRAAFLTAHVHRNSDMKIVHFGTKQCIDPAAFGKSVEADYEAESAAYKAAYAAAFPIMEHFKGLQTESADDIAKWRLGFKQRLSDELAWLEKHLLDKVFVIARGSAGKQPGLYPSCVHSALEGVALPAPNHLDFMSRVHCWIATTDEDSEVQAAVLREHQRCEFVGGGTYVQMADTINNAAAAFLWEESSEWQDFDPAPRTSQATVLLLHHASMQAAEAALEVTKDNKNKISAKAVEAAKAALHNYASKFGTFVAKWLVSTAWTLDGVALFDASHEWCLAQTLELAFESVLADDHVGNKGDSLRASLVCHARKAIGCGEEGLQCGIRLQSTRTCHPAEETAVLTQDEHLALVNPSIVKESALVEAGLSTPATKITRRAMRLQRMKIAQLTMMEVLQQNQPCNYDCDAGWSDDSVTPEDVATKDDASEDEESSTETTMKCTKNNGRMAFESVADVQTFLKCNGLLDDGGISGQQASGDQGGSDQASDGQQQQQQSGQSGQSGQQQNDGGGDDGGNKQSDGQGQNDGGQSDGGLQQNGGGDNSGQSQGTGVTSTGGGGGNRHQGRCRHLSRRYR